MNFTPKITELGKELEEMLLDNLTMDEVFAHFGRENVLSHLKPVDRLAGLEPEVIEDYLKQLKRQQK
jgi:hypothetical protein